ncbi:MAG TPA: HAD-IIA family hydrolase [Baekduia sp.]
MSELSPLVGEYAYMLLDLDGCIYVGEEAIPGSVEAVAALRAAGIGVAFVTNDGRRSGEEYVRKLWGLGMRAALEEVVTVGGAIQHVLATTDRWRAAYVIGAPVMHRHVVDAGLKIVNGRDVPPPDVVVVAAHDRFSYDELRDATQAVLGGAELVCAGRDPIFPMPGGPWPGTGAVVAAVEAATGVEAINLGKPAAQPFWTALERLGADDAGPATLPPRPPSAAERLAAAPTAPPAVEPVTIDDTLPVDEPPAGPRALVVGDRLDADLAGAHAAGLDAAIVLSGATTEREARAAEDPAPVAIAATLAELVFGER